MGVVSLSVEADVVKDLNFDAICLLVVILDRLVNRRSGVVGLDPCVDVRDFSGGQIAYLAYRRRRFR